MVGYSLTLYQGPESLIGGHIGAKHQLTRLDIVRKPFDLTEEDKAPQ